MVPERRKMTTMKKLILCTVALTWAGSLFGKSFFTNYREAESRFIKSEDRPRIEAMYKKHGKTNLERRFEEMMGDKDIATCATKVVKKLAWLEVENSVIAQIVVGIEICRDV